MLTSLAETRRAQPHSEIKQGIAEAIEAYRSEILDLSARIHANPEPAFEEHQASRWVAEIVGRHGFEVEYPAGRLTTAVRGRLSGGRGSDGPRIGVLAEYDALPGLGHGCGHNTMAASGVGAAIALAEIRNEFTGEIVFLGTPAEERGSGKQIMIDDGLFEGVDAALLYHPCDRSHVASQPLASEDVTVTFHGLQAHAAADPWKGKNALDALVLLFSSVGLWRQQLRRDARVHGIVTEGGTAANIIPDRASAWFIIRSADQAYYEHMRERFRAPAEGAALATDTTVEVLFSGGSMTMRQNGTLEARWVENAAAYGIEDQGPDPSSGSTDMGNVSWVCPTIHPELAIADEGDARPFGRLSRCRSDPAGRARRRSWRRRSSRRPSMTCWPTRRSSRPRGGNSTAAPRMVIHPGSSVPDR